MNFYVWIRRTRGWLWMIRRVHDTAAGPSHLDTETRFDVALGFFAVRVSTFTDTEAL